MNTIVYTKNAAPAKRHVHTEFIHLFAASCCKCKGYRQGVAPYVLAQIFHPFSGHKQNHLNNIMLSSL